MAALVLAFLIVPTLIVIPMSFSESQYLEFPPREWSLRWYRNYFASTAWMQATVTSFQAGALTTVLATPLGTLAAYGLFASRYRWAHMIHVLMITPIIVPVILVAIAVFYVYVKIKLVNSLTGIVLAHSMLAIPLVIMIVTSALKSFDMNQEMVARSLGASRARAFLSVTLPQIRFAVISSALLAFLTSFDEVDAGDVRLGRRQLHPDAQHVHGPARPDRPDHRRHLHADDRGDDGAAGLVAALRADAARLDARAGLADRDPAAEQDAAPVGQGLAVAGSGAPPRRWFTKRRCGSYGNTSSIAPAWMRCLCRFQ